MPRAAFSSDLFLATNQGTNKRSIQNKFRSLLLESLERRQMFAMDSINTISQDVQSSPNVATLQSWISNPSTAGSIAPKSYSEFDSSRLTAADGAAISDVQADAIDRVANLSKQTFAPTQQVGYFNSTIPTRQSLSSSLVGSSISPTADWNSGSEYAVGSVDTISAEVSSTQFVDGSVIGILFQPFQRQASSQTFRRAENPSNRTTLSWVGAFCSEDGTEIFPSSLTKQTLNAGEGESSEESLIPAIAAPPMDSTSHDGSFTSFAPSTQSSFSTIETFGAFTPSSLSNPDLTLDGLHWVLERNLTW